MRSRVPSGRKPGRRVWAAGLAALYLASLGLSGLHLAVVEHAICEHGDVVHEGEEARVEAAAADAIQAIVDDHHHCELDQRSDRFTVVVASPLEAPAVVADLAGGVALPEGRLAPTRALFRLAPKQSPPV